AEVVERSQLVLSFGEACREYARETLSPAVRKEARSLIFEADSATFVARGTFEAFNKRKPAYTFREASLNPLNPTNRPDAQEEELIRRLQDDPLLEELRGFYSKDGHEQFFVARPIVVQSVCLQCHDTPQSAPREVVDRYGTHSGFGWKVGEINSALL